MNTVDKTANNQASQGEVPLEEASQNENPQNETLQDNTPEDDGDLPASNPFVLNRFNQTLLGVLVLQLFIAAVVLWPSNAAESSRLTLPHFEVADVSQLSITNDQGEQIALQRDGDAWVWPERGAFPVNAAKVTEILTKVVELDTNRLVTRTEASHKRLQVADDSFARQLVVDTMDGESYTLYIGSAPSSGSTHVRLADQVEAYLTNELSTWEIDPRVSNWIDTLYYSTATASVMQIRLQNASADLIFMKDENDEWTLSDLTADEAMLSNNVVSLVNQVAAIRMVEPLGTTQEDWYGFDTPLATVTITTNSEADGEQTTEFTIGSKNEDNQHVLKSSHSPYYVLVAEFSVSNIIERTRADYLEQPAEETNDDEAADEATNDEVAPAQSE